MSRPSTTTLIYSATGLPPGMNLNPLTRTVAGTPAYGSAGTAPVALLRVSALPNTKKLCGGSA